MNSMIIKIGIFRFNTRKVKILREAGIIKGKDN